MRFTVAIVVLVGGCGEYAKPFGVGGFGFDTGGVSTGDASTGGASAASTGGTPGTGGVTSSGGRFGASGGVSGTGGISGTGGTAAVTNSGGVTGGGSAGGDGVPIVVLPLGDSITYGQGCVPLNAYRKQLGDLAAASGYKLQYVGSVDYGTTGYSNGTEAYPGARIDELTGYVAGHVATYGPELIISYAGMNDCIQDFNFSTVATRYRTLIGQMRAEKPSVVVAIVKLNPSSAAAVNARITAFNAQLDTIAASYSSGVVVVDASEGFSVAAHLYDQWHPNCMGYLQVGTALYFNGVERYIRARPAGSTLGTGGISGTGGTPGTGGMPPPGPQPCDGFCTGTTAIAPKQDSGALGTDAVCRQMYGTIAGIACGNFTAPRTLTVNGAVVSCSGASVVPPPQHNGGYCFVAPAGQMPTAYFTTY